MVFNQEVLSHIIALSFVALVYVLYTHKKLEWLFGDKDGVAKQSKSPKNQMGLSKKQTASEWKKMEIVWCQLMEMARDCPYERKYVPISNDRGMYIRVSKIPKELWSNIERWCVNSMILSGIPKNKARMMAKKQNTPMYLTFCRTSIKEGYAFLDEIDTKCETFKRNDLLDMIYELNPYLVGK